MDPFWQRAIYPQKGDILGLDGIPPVRYHRRLSRFAICLKHNGHFFWHGRPKNMSTRDNEPIIGDKKTGSYLLATHDTHNAR
jgi:hypothetical protein